MKYIKQLIDHIDDELCGARKYAEDYVEQKVNGNQTLASRFKEMSNDELKHATYLHELATDEIKKISSVYTPPQSMLDEWTRGHNKYVEKSAWIKQMLAM